MIEEIRQEIESLEQSATRLTALAADNPAIRKNAEIILTFVYILKFITPGKAITTKFSWVWPFAEAW
jgi:hypothetical protein